MNATLLELRTMLEQDLNLPPDDTGEYSTAQLNRAINDAYAWLSTQNFRENIIAKSIRVQANQSSVALPDDVMSVSALSLGDEDYQREDLRKVMQDQPTFARSYALSSDRLYVLPITTTDQDYLIVYKSIPDKLKEDGSRIIFSRIYEKCLITKAIAYLYTHSGKLQEKISAEQEADKMVAELLFKQQSDEITFRDSILL
jgi:hypothetical protein